MGMARGSLALGAAVDRRVKSMRCGRMGGGRASSFRHVTLGMVPPLTLVLSCYAIAKDTWISCLVIDVMALHNLLNLCCPFRSDAHGLIA